MQVSAARFDFVPQMWYNDCSGVQPRTEPFCKSFRGGNMQVYLITNKVNGKQYVGQTHYSLSRRWKEHIDWSKNNRKSVLHKAVFKYGVENFCIEPLHLCLTKEEMDFVEMFYIIFLNSKIPLGYNMTDGGDGALGHKHDETSRAKIKTARAKQVMPPRSDETKKRMSIAISAAKPWNHGTKTGRINHECTCELCLQWSRDKWQKDKVKILETRKAKGLPLVPEVWNKGTAKGFYKNGNHWQVSFTVKGKLKNFGTFDTEVAAKAWASWVGKELRRQNG